jgi:RNA polymerase sigma-70 factor (ECF subfamily)
VERTGQTTDLTGLVRLAKSGQVAAVEQLVDGYAPRLYGLLYRMTGSATDAEDLLQETYIKMLRGLGNYEENGRFEPWLFSIAANLARDWLRRQGRSLATKAASTEEEVELAIPLEETEVEHRLVLAEQTDQLQRALAQLSAAEREVVTLRFFSDLSFKEIATVLKVPLGTALARAHRALKHLREKLPRDAV